MEHWVLEWKFRAEARCFAKGHPPALGRGCARWMPERSLSPRCVPGLREQPTPVTCEVWFQLMPVPEQGWLTASEL